MLTAENIKIMDEVRRKIGLRPMWFYFGRSIMAEYRAVKYKERTRAMKEGQAWREWRKSGKVSRLIKGKIAGHTP
jgi:hypothetical protein